MGTNISRSNLVVTANFSIPANLVAEQFGIFGSTSEEEIYRILRGYLSISGGGLLILQSDPVIRNAVIEYNRAGK
jgi:hypothetical protein